MFSEYNSTNYFINLLALSVVLLPLCIVIPSNFIRRILFILSGAYLLYFIAPRLLLLYCISWLLVFVLQRLVAVTSERNIGTAVLWICIVFTLAPMVIWKLWYNEFNIQFNLIGNDALAHLSTRLWEIDLARDIIIPIGLSFATFRAIDLLIKTYLGKLEGLSLDRVLFYGFFPAVQVVGPVMEYDEIQKQGDDFKTPSAEDIFNGLMRITFGMIKILLLAAVLQKSLVIFQTYQTTPVYMIWIYLFVYTWFFYLNFSGYSDLAVGISRIFGFKLKENFCFPFFRKNIADYWNNWHMSLSRFAQRNVFVPMGGYRKETQLLALFVTMMVIALWHDISFGMVLFGIYHGTGLIVHRVYVDRFAKKNVQDTLFVTWGKIFTTYVFVTLGFVLVALPGDRVGSFYMALIGM